MNNWTIKLSWPELQRLCELKVVLDVVLQTESKALDHLPDWHKQALSGGLELLNECYSRATTS